MRASFEIKGQCPRLAREDGDEQGGQRAFLGHISVPTATSPQRPVCRPLGLAGGQGEKRGNGGPGFSAQLHSSRLPVGQGAAGARVPGASGGDVPGGHTSGGPEHGLGLHRHPPACSPPLAPPPQPQPTLAAPQGPSGVWASLLKTLDVDHWSLEARPPLAGLARPQPVESAAAAHGPEPDPPPPDSQSPTASHFRSGVLRPLEPDHRKPPGSQPPGPHPGSGRPHYCRRRPDPQGPQRSSCEA